MGAVASHQAAAPQCAETGLQTGRAAFDRQRHSPALPAFHSRYGAIISGRGTDASFKRNKDIVGLFGLFGKKDDKEDKNRKPAAGPAASNAARAHEAAANASRATSSMGQREPERDDARNARNLARGDATAKKIDAIESEMSSEFTSTQPVSNTIPAPVPEGPVTRTTPAKPSAANAAGPTKAGKRTVPLPIFESTLPR
jgi:hypothetical protein